MPTAHLARRFGREAHVITDLNKNTNFDIKLNNGKK